MRTKFVALIIFSLFTNVAHSHDSERIEKLEKEVEELKLLMIIVAGNTQSLSVENTDKASKTEKYDQLENWASFISDISYKKE